PCASTKPLQSEGVFLFIFTLCFISTFYTPPPLINFMWGILVMSPMNGLENRTQIINTAVERHILTF
ncbi:MAG: hypothetical protein ACK45I_04370, partial [Bacteroidota bacterium]